MLGWLLAIGVPVSMDMDVGMGKDLRNKDHQQQHYSCYSVIRHPADERRDS
jgi:hypothetical protein